MKATYNDSHKKCKKCKKEFPNTLEYFYHAKQKNKDGSYRKSLRSTCKKCYSGPKKGRIVKTHKVCKNCNTIFPNTNEHFRIRTDIRGCKYLNYLCKKCERIRHAKVYVKNDKARRNQYMSNLLGVDIAEYITGKYMGWAGYKSKNPSSTYEEYLQYKSSSRERSDVKRKQQRDMLSDNYVKTLIVKGLNIKVKDLDDYPEFIQAYKINILIKRKAYEKCNRT